MVRKVDYDSRRRSILSATINRYIKEANPVSSEDLARDFELSPATIRNIFADLEEEGYLTHPYTSGGRIPTNKGYRYYVDFLILQMELLEEEKDLIQKEYENRVNRLEDILDKTSELVSQITHYTAITSVIDWQGKFFYKGLSLILEQPEFRDFQRVRFLISLLEDKKQRLLHIINQEFCGKVKIYIGEELDCQEIKGCSLVVSSYQVKNKPSGRLAVLGPMRMEYEHIIPALEYISSVLTDVINEV